MTLMTYNIILKTYDKTLKMTTIITITVIITIITQSFILQKII